MTIQAIETRYKGYRFRSRLMPTIARIIGGAGTGKTTRLLDLMAGVIEAGDLAPDQIGFCSFTRAARSEASVRAAERFAVPQQTLEQDGWFRTLHSIAYRMLGVNGELLSDKAADRKWLEESLQEPVAKTPGGSADEGLAAVAFEASSDAQAALGLWDAARNRLEPYANAHARAELCNDRLPPLDYCRKLIERFEQAKRLDGRCDFTDLLGRYSGWRFDLDGPYQGRPEGDVPVVPVWFLDEQQDTSALLDAVCRRLIEPSRWVYVVGDPFQAVYGWAGADPRHFLAWPVAKEEIMPVSYRCPRAILELGEAVLRDCSNYFDRKIAPASDGGEIDATHFGTHLADDIDPRESWLLLARSNYHARRLAGMLDSRQIPWTPTRGNGGWNQPVQHTVIAALYNLERGAPIDGGEWLKILDRVPSRLKDQWLFDRGTKAKFEKTLTGARAAQDAFPWVLLGELEKLGATPLLIDLIRTGGWRPIVEGADRYVSACEAWGEDCVREPRVQVGTVHSVKGREADNVLLLTSTSRPVARSMETDEGADEERRVAYVAVTRARKRLIVARESTANSMEIPV